MKEQADTLKATFRSPAPLKKPEVSKDGFKDLSRRFSPSIGAAAKETTQIPVDKMFFGFHKPPADKAKLQTRPICQV
jgi:hypothetical protein